MKARELMLCDWVRMRRIDVENATYYTSKVLCLAKDGFLEYEPIPLTEEILKANGLTLHRDTYYLNLGYLGNDWVRSIIEVHLCKQVVIGIECNYFEYTNRVHLIANYVHEFQHALRLCGLNDLADNFKIE